MKVLLIAFLFLATTLFAADPSGDSPQPSPSKTGEPKIGCWTGRTADDTDTGAVVREIVFPNGETTWLAVPEDYPFEPRCFDVREKLH